MNNKHKLEKRGFDVVVFVATNGELEAVLKNTEKLNEAKWKVEHDNNGEIIHTLLVKNKSGRIFRLALQKLPTMGAEACVYYVSRFLSEHPCPLVTMVGICAGESKKTKKGDIIIPGKVASIFNGKESETKTKIREFRPNNRFHPIKEKLRKEIYTFEKTDWILSQKEIASNKKVFCINEEIDISLKFEETLVMAQVAHVRAYSNSFDDLKKYASREVVALEMESAALAYVVEKYEEEACWLVIKGVQDYADSRKDHKYREFCSWASFTTLIKFLENTTLDLWEYKVRLGNDIERGLSSKRKEECDEAYREGNYPKAITIGKEIFESRPDEASIWRTYILALLRQQQYKQAADVIGIADYYIQEGKIEEKFVPGYLIGKTEYYRRLGAFKDAEVQIELVLKYENKSEFNEQVAEAYYNKGRIYLDIYRHGSGQAIDIAIGCFQAAINLWETKYWAEVSLLLVKYLKTKKNPFSNIQIDKLQKLICSRISDTKNRPSPHIYYLKLHALQAAVGEITLDDLQRNFDLDVKYLRDHREEKCLSLPNDFFMNFDNDCRMMFSKEEDRYLVLSMLYKWAAEVTKNPSTPKS